MALQLPVATLPNDIKDFLPVRLKHFLRADKGELHPGQALGILVKTVLDGPEITDG